VTEPRSEFRVVVTGSIDFTGPAVVGKTLSALLAFDSSQAERAPAFANESSSSSWV
jgi:hypothetical protein